jgi:hypothetical protein
MLVEPPLHLWSDNCSFIHRWVNHLVKSDNSTVGGEKPQYHAWCTCTAQAATDIPGRRIHTSEHFVLSGWTPPCTCIPPPNHHHHHILPSEINPAQSPPVRKLLPTSTSFLGYCARSSWLLVLVAASNATYCRYYIGKVKFCHLSLCIRRNLHSYLLCWQPKQWSTHAHHTVLPPAVCWQMWCIFRSSLRTVCQPNQNDDSVLANNDKSRQSFAAVSNCSLSPILWYCMTITEHMMSLKH